MTRLKIYIFLKILNKKISQQFKCQFLAHSFFGRNSLTRSSIVSFGGYRCFWCNFGMLEGGDGSSAILSLWPLGSIFGFITQIIWIWTFVVLRIRANPWHVFFSETEERNELRHFFAKINTV